MAYIDAVPFSGSMAPVQGSKIELPMAINSSSGSPVNMTGWNAFALTVIPTSGVGLATPPLTSTSAIAGTATGATVTLTAAQTTALLPGLYTMIGQGKSTSGDDLQTIFNITLNVQRGS